MDAVLVAIALLIVAINAFFVAAEYGFVRVRVTRIEDLVQRGVPRAAAAREVLRHLDAAISACQLGITLTSLGLGWVGEPAFAHLLEPLFGWAGAFRAGAAHTVAIVLAFLLITFLHVVLGELVPKTVAITYAEATALAVSWPLRVFRFLFWPLITFMNRSANLVVRLIGLPAPTERSLAHSEAELRMILAVSRKSGALSEAHGRLLSAALDFPDRAVRQIMVPRGDVLWLDANRSYAESLARAREYGHTRIPLCDGTIDRVVGIVHIKDLFIQPPPSIGAPTLAALARRPLFIPESAKIQQALALFQRQKFHLAIVVDEYGGTAGLVTLEDILEELIGEIQDEFDQESPKVVRQPGGRILADASLTIAELETATGTHDDVEEDVDTVGGLVLARLGRIARVGDSVPFGPRTLEVVRVRGRRILRVAVSPPEV
ncbi:MAG TPA: hemolysin family protein [Candidatus Polarisedimenticolaceae bacterium]|nr:hemolysin family protein [Candidatus Polarisedimenticolaceae bacterium]